MHTEAIQRFYKLRESGIIPSTYITLSALKACINLSDTQTSKRIHDYLIESGDYLRDVTVCNTLVHMYSKFGNMVEAHKVFDKISRRSIVSWNTLIFGYADNGEYPRALELYSRMRDEGFVPNGLTYVAVLKAITSSTNQTNDKLELLQKGMKIHSHIVDSGLENDAQVATTLVDMYAKCGSMSDSKQVFDKMVKRSLVTWNSLIFGYTESGDGEYALTLYSKMQDEGFQPDARSYVAALKACTITAEREQGCKVGQNTSNKVVKLTSIKKGMELHARVLKSGEEHNTILANSLISMYLKCGSIYDARRVFDTMSKRSIVSWNALIYGYGENSEGNTGVELMEHTRSEGFEPNTATYISVLTALSSMVESYPISLCLERGKVLHRQIVEGRHDTDYKVSSTLVDLYTKCGCMQEAKEVFDQMNEPDVVAWNALILGYAQQSNGKAALQSFARMQNEGVTPDGLTFVSALKACSSLGCLTTGKELHNELYSAGLEKELTVMNSLIDFYGKAGSMVEARKVFNRMLERDVVSWNAVISGYAENGEATEVFKLFQYMQECVIPDAITYLCVLKACSYAGLVKEGTHYFQLMKKSIEPEIEHYTCMVDLYGRSNRLAEALNMIKEMPFVPDQPIWTSLLGAARKWNDVKTAKLAFDEIVKLKEGKDSGAYVLMANAYAAEM